MSILIKGMEMPKNCDMCWALDDYGDYPRCRITEEQRGYNFHVREKRMDKCPLTEIPPHGRLIDADALIKPKNQHIDVLADEWYVTVRTIETALTIIPAEEGEA